MKKLNLRQLEQIISMALREDKAYQDATTNALIPKDQISEGFVIVKENATICGVDITEKVLRVLDPGLRFHAIYQDGAHVRANTKVATFRGRTQALLKAERVAVNFLGYLSGIATLTRLFVEKTSHTKAKIFDTRKTTPGLRFLERYAVRCGGGQNHRMNLNELVLIKDNHRNACHPHLTIPEAIDRARRMTRKGIEIEVDNLDQFKQALTASPDIIMLDNMSCAHMTKAVKIIHQYPPNTRPQLEASGGITLKNITRVANTGVERISIGSLTHSHRAIDVSMELTD